MLSTAFLEKIATKQQATLVNIGREYAQEDLDFSAQAFKSCAAYENLLEEVLVNLERETERSLQPGKTAGFL